MSAPRLHLSLAILAALLASVWSPAARSQQADYGGQVLPPILKDSVADDGSEADDEDDTTSAARGRAVVQDGDPVAMDEPAMPQDGVIDVSDPTSVADGDVDATQIDVREAEDAQAFGVVGPTDDARPAGYDPLLFQIEDLDPIRDNRTVRRLFRLEPYDPVGVRVGNFVLFPEIEIGGVYSSNVFSARDAQGDVAGELRPSARLVSDWQRHALEFRAISGLSSYDTFDSEDERSYLLEGRGRLDVTRRTNIQALVSHSVSQESRSALNATTVGSRVDQTTERAEVALNHRFNRLSVQLRGGVTDYQFGNSEFAGVTSSNADRDYTQYDETARAQWEFKPTLSAFAEAGVNRRRYDLAALSDGINRSSDGQRYRAGVAFGNTSEILRGEISLGWGVQSPDDGRLDDIDGLLIDANATWRVTALTSVLFEARSDISETTTPDVAGALYRFAGVEVRHALRRHLVGTVGLSYATQKSGDGIIDESEVQATTGAEYYLSPETIVFGRYTHSRFDAVDSASDYNADEVRFGVRLRR